MSNNRHDDGQLTFNFEPNVNVDQRQHLLASFGPGNAGDVPRLQLVINNSSTRRLSPNSDEITQMLADQARALRW